MSAASSRSRPRTSVSMPHMNLRVASGARTKAGTTKKSITECLVVDTKGESDQGPGHMSLVHSEWRGQESRCLPEQGESERCPWDRLTILAAVRNRAKCWCRDLSVSAMKKYTFLQMKTCKIEIFDGGPS